VVAPVKDVPPLTCHDLKGRPYARRPGTEDEIRRALGSAQATWGELARAAPPDRLSSEALVFLIRSVRDSNRNLAGELIESLNHRILQTAGRWCRGFDPMTTEDIRDKVLTEMLSRLLALQPTRASEFLEIAFERVVKTCTLKQVAKHPKRIVKLGGGGSSDPEDADSREERPEDQVPDPGPGPEEIISELADEEDRAALISNAQAAIKDPRHLEAVLLRFVHGWPVTARDPSKPSLARRFGKTARQIQNWINTGIQQMRESIGEDHD
jgi:hypothetical protein